MMKHVSAALLALFTCFAATPLTAAAQERGSEASFAMSPDLHASFEYDYALEATFMIISQPHRAQVASIAQACEHGLVSEADASKRINAVLSPDERGAVSEIAQSFWASLQQIYANAGSANPVKAALTKEVVQSDSGRFLLLLLESASSLPSPATIQ